MSLWTRQHTFLVGYIYKNDTGISIGRFVTTLPASNLTVDDIKTIESILAAQNNVSNVIILTNPHPSRIRQQ
jgi:hypothetical protein